MTSMTMFEWFTTFTFIRSVKRLTASTLDYFHIRIFTKLFPACAHFCRYLKNQRWGEYTSFALLTKVGVCKSYHHAEGSWNFSIETFFTKLSGPQVWLTTHTYFQTTSESWFPLIPTQKSTIPHSHRKIRLPLTWIFYGDTWLIK